jgi:hypothetical protein
MENVPVALVLSFGVNNFCPVAASMMSVSPFATGSPPW